jgi:hypothetical protein
MYHPPLLAVCATQADDRYRLAAKGCRDNRYRRRTVQNADEFGTATARWSRLGIIKEFGRDGPKIQTMFGKIGKAFRFIPGNSHYIL